MNPGKLIVVEGMDNAGKTTLAQKIAKALRGIYLKVERPSSGPDLMAFHGIINVARNYANGIVVTDRHVAISEPIYGKVIRGGHDLDEQEIEICTGFIDLLIYCRPPDHVLMSTIMDRPQMEGVVEHSSALVVAYDRYFEGYHPATKRPEVMRYDFTSDKDEIFMGRVRANISE